MEMNITPQVYAEHAEEDLARGQRLRLEHIQSGRWTEQSADGELERRRAEVKRRQALALHEAQTELVPMGKYHE